MYNVDPVTGQPIDPMTGMPVQQQLPPQGTAFNQFMGSPGLAMASQAINNMMALRRGRVPQTTPVMAMQQAQRQNEMLMQRRAEMLSRDQQRQDMIRAREQQLMLEWHKQGQPTAHEEKLNTYMRSIGLDPADPASITDPRIPDFLSRTGGNSTTTIQLPGGAEEANAWEKNRLERSISKYNGIQDAAAQAGDRAARFSQLRMLNQDIGEGGPLGEAAVGAKQLLQSMGIDLPFVDENTSSAELYKAIATENTFERTAMLKGAISEKELGLAGMMDASLSNTQSGRDFILNYRIAQARRAEQIAEAADLYMTNSGERFFDESKFRRSDEFKSVRDRAFATPELLMSAKKANPTALKDFKLVNGTWYVADENGDAVPYFGEVE